MTHFLLFLAFTITAHASFELKSDGHQVCRIERSAKICFPTADAVARSQYGLSLGTTIDLYKTIANFDAWLTAKDGSREGMRPIDKAIVKGAIFIPAEQIHQLANRFRKLKLSNFAVNGNQALTETSKTVQIVGTLSWQDRFAQSGKLNFDGHVVIAKLDLLDKIVTIHRAALAQATFAALIEMDMISGKRADKELLCKDLGRTENADEVAKKLLKQIVGPLVAGTLYLAKAGELDPNAPTPEPEGDPL